MTFEILEVIIEGFMAVILFLTMSALVALALTGGEFILRFWKSNEFETKKWKYYRVRKEDKQDGI